MKPETIVWTSLILVGVLLLALRISVTGEIPGREYVRADPQAVSDEHPEGRWTLYRPATQRAYAEAEAEAQQTGVAQTDISFSLSRTIGIWIAAFFTLAIFSFLYKDNPFYKVAESVVVGVSAAYWMVVGFWTTIVPNLLGKLSPEMVKGWAMPGLDQERELIYLVPLILGIMLLWRLAPKGGWISRWPLAFFIGVFCGIRLMGYLHGDFLAQIRNTIAPLAAFENGDFDIWKSLEQVFIVGGVLVCLVYFFFSFEHKGIVGRTAKVGIWVLMITFGAGFGYTVMGRIALLAIRLEFLFDDWLWLIDPTDKRLLS